MQLFLGGRRRIDAVFGREVKTSALYMIWVAAVTVFLMLITVEYLRLGNEVLRLNNEVSQIHKSIGEGCP